ncbi:MAG: NYN domain-containing protein [Planctomycetes bacterium]|jgi:predicted RNA-binding protein with PIN domain|nr:NYN domain-containing protein [Planctomycetota bacterium]
MKLLVDGHNAIHALGLGTEDHEAAREMLARRVAEAAEGEAVVFFDARSAPRGLPAGGRLCGVAVRFCRKATADEEIVAEVRRAQHPSDLLVVTGDRELAGRVRQLGARTAPVARLLDPASRPPEPEKPRAGADLSPEDFGLPERVNLKHPPRDLRS